MLYDIVLTRKGGKIVVEWNWDFPTSEFVESTNFENWESTEDYQEAVEDLNSIDYDTIKSWFNLGWVDQVEVSLHRYDDGETDILKTKTFNKKEEL